MVYFFQIIIRSTHANISHPTSDGVVTFGPAFDRDFMLRVLDLQRSIEAIGAGTDWGFDRICFAPLRNKGDEKRGVTQCAVQSVWGYYQNNVATFNGSSLDPNKFVVNYLDRLVMCTQ